LYFEYQVAKGLNDGDGISIDNSWSNFNMNGGSIKDALGNNATLYTSGAANSVYVVDSVAPSPNFNVWNSSSSAYWRYSGTSNWLTGYDNSTLAPGTWVDFSLWASGDPASIDVYSRDTAGGSLTRLQSGTLRNYGSWVELYWVQMPTTPMVAGTSTVYNYLVDFVFKDALGNEASTRNTVIGDNSQTFIFKLWNTVSPMVLDLNGDGVHTVNKSSGVMFDVAATGEAVLTGWTNGEDGLLALDLNGDGKINDGSELFGNATRTADGKASDGYQALRQYDLNADGVIDANDEVFGKLQVWVDGNGNGTTEAGELHSIKDVGVESLSLDALSSTKTENGNIHAMTSSWTGTDGKVNDMADVWFANSSLEQLVQNATGAQMLDLDADAGANVQDLKLSDVLGLDSQVMVIKAGANDVVNIDHTGWSHSDFTTTFDNHSYNLWNNGNAYALIDQNAQVHQVI
jgi:hypothetical protein